MLHHTPSQTLARLLGSAALALLGACATSQPPAPPVTAPGSQKVVTRAVPPADLSQKLTQYAPLRSILLGESGSATLAITVREDGSVLPGAARESTGPSFTEGCARMLASTRWTPARGEGGQPVAADGFFRCEFDASEIAPERGALRKSPRADPRATIAVPPKAPNYGSTWYNEHAGFRSRDAFAALELRIDGAGRPEVLAAVPESDPDVVAACRSLIENGPSWTAARDTAGRPIETELTFQCVVQLMSVGKELSIKEIATIGPISPRDFTKVLKLRVANIADCFETAVQMRMDIAGTHRLALEIGADGRVLRSEWLSKTDRLELTSRCVSDALMGLRFVPRPAATIADLQLYVSGAERH